MQNIKDEVLESQNNKKWWSMGEWATKAVEGLAAFRGFQAGVNYAEAFEVGRFVVNSDESCVHEYYAESS